jgi:hypothetical protein
MDLQGIRFAVSKPQCPAIGLFPREEGRLSSLAESSQ